LIGTYPRPVNQPFVQKPVDGEPSAWNMPIAEAPPEALITTDRPSGYTAMDLPSPTWFVTTYPAVPNVGSKVPGWACITVVIAMKSRVQRVLSRAIGCGFEGLLILVSESVLGCEQPDRAVGDRAGQEGECWFLRPAQGLPSSETLCF